MGPSAALVRGAREAELPAEICNRGTNPVQDGVVVEFLQTEMADQPIEAAALVCQAVTSKLLLPGDLACRRRRARVRRAVCRVELSA